MLLKQEKQLPLVLRETRSMPVAFFLVEIPKHRHRPAHFWKIINFV